MDLISPFDTTPFRASSAYRFTTARRILDGPPRLNDFVARSAPPPKFPFAIFAGDADPHRHFAPIGRFTISSFPKSAARRPSSLHFAAEPTKWPAGAGCAINFDGSLYISLICDEKFPVQKVHASKITAQPHIHREHGTALIPHAQRLNYA